jgi:branched-chain amino acid transport system permease protein
VGIWPARWADPNAIFYLLTFALCVGGILMLRHAAHAPFGYALRAARDNAPRAAASGLDVRRLQWAAFTFAGAMAGLAGGLFVFAKGSVFPNELEIARSFDALIVVFLGGVKTLSGGWVGGAVFEAGVDWLTRFEYWRLTLGLVVLFIVTIAPQGIVGTARAFWARVQR